MFTLLKVCLNDEHIMMNIKAELR